MNTDEPLVEASIVGNTLPEGMSYKGFPMSTAAVNRGWLCGNRSKGGMTHPQALTVQQGRASRCVKENSRWYPHQDDY
jgi:hypothetical protein